MHSQGPVLSKLHSLIQQGLRRCLASASDSSSGQRSSFHDWCDVQQPQQTCHTALELHEVLIQVFQHLDSKTLCTTIPLVCQHWKAAATSDQIWAPLCDPLLLAAVQRQVPAAAQASSTKTDADASTAAPLSTAPCTGTESLRNSVQCPAAVPARSCYSVALPLLHHAVYRYNLLRNPNFLEAANADYCTALQRTRSGSSDTGVNGKPHAVLTIKQRKVAWVTTVGTPSWEVAPAGSAHAGDSQPLAPLEYPWAPATSSSLRLQDWLFGSSKSAANATAASAAKSNSDETNASSSGSIGDGSSASSSVQQQEDVQCVRFLATGSNWTEVVQVIDLMGELTARGLDASTAAIILDQGVLAICLTFWVAAAPDTPAPHITSQPAAADDSSNAADAAVQEAAAGPSSLRMQPSQTHQQSPAQFAAALMLDGGQVPLRSFQTFVRNDSSHHFFSKRLAVDPADGWRRYAYVVPCCPKGLRRAVVLLRGRGTGPGSNAAMAALAAGSNGSGSSSSGTGGVQFACAQLSFIRNDEIQGIAAEDCLAGWQDRVVHGF